MKVLISLTFALLACAPAHADDFLLGDNKLVSGVLLSDEGGVYRIRIMGGVIELPKSDIVRIVKDGLTVKAIERAEANKRDALEEANKKRREVQAKEQAEALEALKNARRAEALDRAEKSVVQSYCPPLSVRYNTVRHIRCR